MEALGNFFEWTIRIMNFQLTLFGFTFSFWQIFIFTTVAGLVAWFLGEVFLGD